MTLLVDRILASVERAPAEPAFIAGGRVVTYRAMLALLSSTVGFLHEKGVRAGDAVALKMGQSPLHCIAFLALARLGALSVPMFPNLREAERAEIFRRFGVRWVLSDAPEAGGHGVGVIVLQGVRARGDESALDRGGFTPRGETPLRAALTSGTTEAQKGFVMTHESFARRLDRRFYGEVSRPRVMPPSLQVIGAASLVGYALAAGGTVVFPVSYEPTDFLAAIHLHCVTHVTLPPANLAALLDQLPEDKPAFPSIVQLRVLGATPSPELVARARRKFSPNLYATYSTTETGVIAMAGPELLASVPHTAGRVVEGARLEVVDAAGRPLPAGERGEIRVAVDGMPSGYHGEASEAFRDGWFYTRDTGYVSAEGLLYVEGRADEVINVGGRKVTAAYIESVLELHPRVREAAVFAFDQGAAGPRLGAAIVPVAGIDWAELERYARASFEAYAPVRYFEVEALPRNVMGKIVRPGLAEFVSANAKRASEPKTRA